MLNLKTSSMRTFIICLSLFLLPIISSAQDKGLLTISSEGTVEIPADIIRFTINLNAEADSPQDAYNLHKERENVLVQLLDKYEISEEDIHFEPISISKSGRVNRLSNNEPSYKTRQLVSLTLTDFDIYEEMQVTLIEENFDNFSGSFMSTDAESGKDKALRKAIQAAKEKAQIIAKEAGIKLGSITGINYSHGQHRPVYAQSRDLSFSEGSGGQLMKYDQIITITANISINFAIMR
jgi:uncharacterized protein YggE